jgi:glycosyltransferase involved in cell wall biosynthesis
LLLARPSKGPSFPLDERVKIKLASTRSSVFGELWWLIRNIPRDADAVVANFYLTTYPTAIVTGLYRPKGYYFVQGYEPSFFVCNPSRKAPPVQCLLARASYHLPLCYFTISTWLQEVLRDVTGRVAVVINDGVDTTVFSPHFPAKKWEDTRIVMSLGRKDPNKGLCDLLEAVRILGNQLPDLRLLIATQDRELVVNTPVLTEIVYPADDEELAMCYRRADVFVFSSLREGFGLPPLEAMACGTPVVTTDCGGVLDYAEDEVNCSVVPVQDPQAMAEAMHRILDDKDSAKRFSEAGRKTACQFTWDVMVDKFESLLAGVL